jgi:predicted nucleotidyltransferase
MRINEFTKTPSVDFDLGNAVEFHDQLNPKLFDGEQMRPDIRQGLLKIAEHFKEFIGVELDVVDVTVSGSNAAYSYTDYSDIDLHIVVQVPNDPEYKQLLDAKKNDYNARHDIKVKGIDVEPCTFLRIDQHKQVGEIDSMNRQAQFLGNQQIDAAQADWVSFFGFQHHG